MFLFFFGKGRLHSDFVLFSSRSVRAGAGERRRSIIVCFSSPARARSFLAFHSVSFFNFFLSLSLSSPYLFANYISFLPEPLLLPPPTAPRPSLLCGPRTPYTRDSSLFLDAPAAPFCVHRMALAGKAAGKDVVWAQRGGGGAELSLFPPSWQWHWRAYFSCISSHPFSLLYSGVLAALPIPLPRPIRPFIPTFAVFRRPCTFHASVFHYRVLRTLPSFRHCLSTIPSLSVVSCKPGVR
ncbi:hypothetical protein B0H13DRAFT_2659660 [Mycena leptocephala]|nr:hypothetical protein B0H13DRAFT_2659660 [Mycena leptocephala]